MVAVEPKGCTAALRVTALSKTFPGTRALDQVSLEVRASEIHALVGGNGSGKSTLIKILAGVHRGDPGGRIEVLGRMIASEHTDPSTARAAGLHVVHQSLGVFPALTVAENLTIGRGFETFGGVRIRWGDVRRRTRDVLERFDIDAEPETVLGRLRSADQRMVAIARALQDQEGGQEGVLLLDEPTAGLPFHEVELLLGALRRYAAQGQTILFVSHRLDEVLDVADAVTILRDGVHVTTARASDLDEPELIQLVAGRPLDRVYPEMPPVDESDTVLEAHDLRGGPLRGVSFRLRHREVLGIAGLIGSGRSELLRMIFGAEPKAHGTLRYRGRTVRFEHPPAAIAAGFAYVPEDRAEDAAFPDLSVRHNLSAADVARYWWNLRLHHRVEQAEARESIRDFLIKTATDASTFASLSGGNQQKVVLARWLRLHPEILLLDEPTQGVDIGARAEIYSLVRRAVAAGASAILVTSDFEELARVCDRVLVLVKGRVVAHVHSPIEPHELTQLSFGAPTEMAS